MKNILKQFAAKHPHLTCFVMLLISLTILNYSLSFISQPHDLAVLLGIVLLFTSFTIINQLIKFFIKQFNRTKNEKE